MEGRQQGLWESFIELWTGRVERVAYALFGAWTMGMALNYVSGSPMSVRTAVLGLAGNLIVVAVAGHQAAQAAQVARKTLATDLVRRGEAFETVERILGHSWTIALGSLRCSFRSSRLFVTVI